MEKFFSLPMDKQNTIIDAAMKAFGANGYKKTSISDIAAAAGISKAMVFHYFGTKKELYFYLVSYCGNLIMKEVNDKFDSNVTDFFDRIMQASEIELAVLRKHPASGSFLGSVYFETNEEVKADLAAMMSQGEEFRSKIAFDGTDTSKFKENVDIKLVMKILMWMVDGFMNTYKGLKDFDAACSDFFDCMNLMRNNFYKEEFVNQPKQ